MSPRRFPPLLSGASVAAAAFTCIVVITAVTLLYANWPRSFMGSSPWYREDRSIILAAAALAAITIYFFAAPRMWSFVKRYSPESQGQQPLPAELVAPCLKSIDFACPACTYNLRCVEHPVCPECSAPIIIYLYGTQKASTRWTGLVVCWLVLTLVAAALVLGSVSGTALDFLSARPNWFRHDSDLLVAAVLSVAALLVCGWRAAVLSIPKPRHRQSVCVRQTALWLAATNATAVAWIGVKVAITMINW